MYKLGGINIRIIHISKPLLFMKCNCLKYIEYAFDVTADSVSKWPNNCVGKTNKFGLSILFMLLV